MTVKLSDVGQKTRGSNKREPVKVDGFVVWKLKGTGTQAFRVGRILKVVPQGVQAVAPRGYKRAGACWGPPRKRESYIISLGGKNAYWPLAKDLTPIKALFESMLSLLGGNVKQAPK
jgi:hypothetical protein